MIKNINDKNEIIDELFDLLYKEFEFKGKNNFSTIKKESIINTVLNFCGVENVNEQIKDVQTLYIKLRQKEMHIVEVAEIIKKKKDFKNIFAVKADLMLVVTNSLFSVEKIDANNINNQIIVNGGIGINENFYRLSKEIESNVYMVNGENLLVDNLCKILIKPNCEDVASFEEAMEEFCLTVKGIKLKSLVVVVDDIYSDDLKQKLKEILTKKLKKLKINYILA